MFIIVAFMVLNCLMAIWYVKQPGEGVLPFGAFYYTAVWLLSIGTFLLSVTGMLIGSILEYPIKGYFCLFLLSLLPTVIRVCFL